MIETQNIEYKSISIIGSGSVAWHLTKQLFACGYSIDSVFSRNLDNAKLLAEQVQARAIAKIEMIPNSDVYLFSVKDNAYEKIIANFPKTTSICAHTSGSLGMNILRKLSDNYGVLYPFQTFSKWKDIDFLNVPFCIESSNSYTENILLDMAEHLSHEVCLLDGEQREYLLLAGVFACNFSNAMYAIAQEILQEKNMNFKIAIPLINETLEKIKIRYPIDAQTGPAVRNDTNIIEKHLKLLKNSNWKELYQLISKIIHKQHLPIL